MVKKNILITGGLGFIGGRLTAFLNETNKFNIYVTSRINKDEIPLEILEKGIKVVDFFGFNEQKKVKLLEKIEIVIHLAALNEVECEKNPKYAIEFNIWETVNLLNLSQKANIKTFIYFSTAHVYSSPLNEVFNEENICRPAYTYSITHKAAEDYILAQRNRTELNAIIIRLSNSFGSPAFDTSDRWTLLVNDICKQAVKDNVIKLISNGQQKRDFITLEDVEKSILILLNKKKSDLFDGIINLASGNAIQIIEMADLVKKQYEKLFSKNIEIQIGEKNDFLNDKLKIEIQRLNSLGIFPENNFEKEIKNMLIFCNAKFN